MIKDVAAKLLFIPLLGLLVPIVTSLFACNNCTFTELVFCNFSYIFITFLLWQGIVFITAFLRNNPHIRKNVLMKVLLLIFCTAFFSVLGITLFVGILKKFFSDVIHHKSIPVYTLSYFALAPIISLTYEILFLQKEQELDSKIVAQLDYERQSAELNALKSELDPHFIFNSFSTLAPLISTDAEKAQTFTTKLAQAYKYLLLNKDRDLISLSDELHFIEDYFFLLQIRHEGKLKLQIELNEIAPYQIMILPFSLQVLLENAIKHNRFSEKAPLEITISLHDQFIQVSNTIYAKPYAVESTHVGLKNLSARYKLTCKRDIAICQTHDKFTVKLPFIKITI